MKELFIVILLVLVCCVGFSEARLFTIFARNSSIDNNVCFSTEVVFTSTCLSSSHCLWKCSLQSTCMSAFYHTDSGECTGCNSAYFRSDDVSEHLGTIYYDRIKKLYGETCSSGDSCIGTNGACWEGTCKCVMGYSYDPKTQTCVDECSSYGSTFQEYLGYRLDSLNDDKHQPVTVEYCKHACATTTGCKSFEYRASISICHSTSATPLSHPNSVSVSTEKNLYIRNCEE